MEKMEADLPVSSVASNVPGLHSHVADTSPIHEGTHDNGGALQDEVLKLAQALRWVPSTQALIGWAQAAHNAQRECCEVQDTSLQQATLATLMGSVP